MTGLAEVHIQRIPKPTPTPKAKAVTYVALCFLFSTPFWFLLAHRSPASRTPFSFTIPLMWCPALAALLTRLWHQRNLRGFGFTLGKPRWLWAALVVPICAGLLVFGAAWVFGVAPLDHAKLARAFSPHFIPIFLIGLVFTLFAALGEELGWRGLLVPELSQYMGFSKLAFLSGIIWAVWHIPLILFTPYHGTGSLWCSVAAFVPVIVASSFVQAWFRLVSGSVWVAMLMHGSWNYFIEAFFPLLTVKTLAGNNMLGEFGWGLPLVAVVLALGCWYLRDRLPKSAQFAGGKAATIQLNPP